MRQKRARGLTERQASALKRVAQSGGLLCVKRAVGDDLFVLKDGVGSIDKAIVKQLIAARALIPLDRGLFDAAPQSYRARLPTDA